jgi:hypothetical protein
MDLIFNLLYRKRFWVGIIILSSIGAAFALIMTKRKEYFIKNAPEAYICFSTGLKMATLGKVSDSKDVYDYLEYVRGNTRFVKWNSGGSISNGQNVKVLDYSSDSSLIKVLIRREKHTMQYPSEEEHWIHKSYVFHKPCQYHSPNKLNEQKVAIMETEHLEE